MHITRNAVLFVSLALGLAFPTNARAEGISDNLTVVGSTPFSGPSSLSGQSGLSTSASVCGNDPAGYTPASANSGLDGAGQCQVIGCACTPISIYNLQGQLTNPNIGCGFISFESQLFPGVFPALFYNSIRSNGTCSLSECLAVINVTYNDFSLYTSQCSPRAVSVENNLTGQYETYDFDACLTPPSALDKNQPFSKGVHGPSGSNYVDQCLIQTAKAPEQYTRTFTIENKAANAITVTAYLAAQGKAKGATQPSLLGAVMGLTTVDSGPIPPGGHQTITLDASSANLQAALNYAKKSYSSSSIFPFFSVSQNGKTDSHVVFTPAGTNAWTMTITR